MCISDLLLDPATRYEVVVDHVGRAWTQVQYREFITKFLCDCGENHRRDMCPEYRPSKGPAPTSRHVPAAVRRRIEARDGFRCRTPGCENPVPLQASHLKPFRDGTPMTEEFLCQHCAGCNDLIEAKKIKIEGEAPLERYYRPDGSFRGYGFDHRAFPHVGPDGRLIREATGDPPEGRRDRA